MARLTEERVEFAQVLEGLFIGAMEALDDPALVEALRAGGLDLRVKLQPAYPAATFFRFATLAARHRYPKLDEAGALRELGRLAVRRGLDSTFLGRAVLQAARLLGPRRALKRLGAVMKNGNNYIDGTVTEVGPTSLEVRLGPLVGPASYYEGVLEESPRILGAREVVVTHLRAEGEDVVWRVEWKE
jgi:uncharacterized protein (TIGR02265 family)